MDGPDRGGAGRGRARAALNVRFADLLSSSPAASDRSLSLDGGISLASSKEEIWVLPGKRRENKWFAGWGQAEESPDSSGEALASPSRPGLWRLLLPPEAAVGRGFPAIHEDSCL